VLASRSPTRAPAGFELGAGGRDVVLDGDGLDSPDHLDEVVNAGEDAVAVVLCHGADVLHEMRRGAGSEGRNVGGLVAVENDPKSITSRRTLPLPDRLVAVLRSAKARQARERLAIGAGGGPWEYVVSTEVGQPYHPQVLSRYWSDTVKAAGVRHIKLNAARHTCATLMHLSGVPAAVIAAWIGHKDASLTMKLYAHSHDDARRAAGSVLNRVVADL
jgi:integrase